MPLSLEQLLERSRRELLDLSTRNRLLSIPVGSKSARMVEVLDERSAEVFRLLVREKKSFSFLSAIGSPPGGSAGSGGGSVASAEAKETGIDLPPREEDGDEKDEGGGAVTNRHVDGRLQTGLSPAGLQARLLGLYRDAQTMLEEQGVNVLYLALGQLKWFEAGPGDTARHAPLVLVPVEIRRNSAADRFRLRSLEEEVQENLSLRARLKADFNVELPEFSEDDDFDPSRYFEAVAAAVSGVKGWEVLPDAMTLGFFSFAKFLMYRDLDPKTWPEGKGLLQHPFITGLLQDGFPPSDALFPEGSHLDEVIPAERLDFVMDADSSQAIVIETVRQGRSVVVQGPPGTGKSQSIANLIVTAVLDGKRVLFVAEKLAALEVVKRRLEREGLGDVCLELHSNKSSKRAVIAELGRTWNLGRPKSRDLEDLIPNLERDRKVLNRHAQVLHEAVAPSGLTPFVVLGRLVQLEGKGKGAGEIVLDGAERWTPVEHQERRLLAEELAARVEEVGVPAQHPWRGVGCKLVLRLDYESVESGIRAFRAALAPLEESAAPLASVLEQPVPGTLRAAEQLAVAARYAGQAPLMDRPAIGHEIWNTGQAALGALVEAGKTLSAAIAATRGRVVDSVWEEDLSSLRAPMAARGRSWFRFLHSDYRGAVARLRGVAMGALPGSCEDRLALVDQILAGQRAWRAVRSGDAAGQAAFGTRWRQESSAWGELETIYKWVAEHSDAGLGAEFRRNVSGMKDPALVARPGAELSARLATARAAILRLFERLSVDCREAFGVADEGDVPLRALDERGAGWLERMEDLSRWNHYFVRARRARALGCAAWVEQLYRGAIRPGEALDVFDRVYLQQWLRHFLGQTPALAEFDGMRHDQRVEEFRRLDRARLSLARLRVLLAHFEQMPAAGGVGPAGIVRSEMERKRGHRTVRRLLTDAGSVVQAIKPVFMMSPLSVAQFLEPGAVEFDLLVVDEASQVQPVDALGAIARCRQIVVVGDSRQLPPTRFFARMTSEEPAPDDENATGAAEVRDLESILGLCCARGLPQCLLRWHYRSRHHSLIAVSNHEFYEDRLFVVPSPHSAAPGLGLQLVPVREGVFDRGASATNRIEAQAVCQAVMDHARDYPGLSLGVAAFSVRQQEALLDELELLRSEHPDRETFFSAHPSEPFFVKNLENVQGDERDVIFISVGYGKDAHGYMAMRFGPLSNEGGERRLNVLISRAKRRCVVFSSIFAEDIDLERASGRGVASFKRFLRYAATGQLGSALRTGRDPESPFEEAVQRALEALGHEVHAQVGVAGFFVDLAVCHPQRPGQYLLGIECDGAAYHAARSARDRDRLRQAVLEDHGWVLHRIWSTDWYQRPADQLDKVQHAIEQALAGTVAEPRSCPGTAGTAGTAGIAATETSETPSGDFPETVEREAAGEEVDADLSALAVPYRMAKFAVPGGGEDGPHELSPEELAEIVARIVRDEGPLHQDEVATRVRDLWKLGRVGSRVQEAVATAVRTLAGSGACSLEDGFLSVTGAPVPVRSREAVASAALRKVDLLPPAEIRAAILALLDAHHGAAGGEIPAAVARILGFKSTSVPLRNAIEAQVAVLQTAGVIAEGNGLMKRRK